MKVFVIYKGIDASIDAYVQKTASDHNLEFLGSGYGWGDRDLEFTGTNQEDLYRFGAALRMSPYGELFDLNFQIQLSLFSS